MSRDRERAHPRISVNKLGEYLVAAPLRRRRIIQDQREPKDFIVPRYQKAQQILVKFLLDGAGDTLPLAGEIERLRYQPGGTDFETESNGLCADAIEAFVEMSDDIDLEGLEVRAGEGNPDQLSIGGVNVSVRPESLLGGRNRAGEETVGALKLYFGKTHPLTDDAGAYVSTILERWVVENLGGKRTRDRDLCLVVDVFEGNIFTAPRAFTRRMSNIEAACQEIARAWGE